LGIIRFRLGGAASAAALTIRPDWVGVSSDLVSGWATLGTAPAYRVVDDVVELRGAIIRAAGDTAFPIAPFSTFPSGDIAPPTIISLLCVYFGGGPLAAYPGIAYLNPAAALAFLDTAGGLGAGRVIYLDGIRWSVKA